MACAVRNTLLIFGIVLLSAPACAPVPEIGPPAVHPSALSAAEQSLPEPDPAPADTAAGTLELGINQAVLLALEHNRDLGLRRIDVALYAARAAEQEAVFDPALAASVTQGREDGLTGGTAFTEDTLTAAGGIEKSFATGTTVELGGDLDLSDSSLNTDPAVTARIGLTMTQALLQGRRPAVNRAVLRQARIDTDISSFELHGYAIHLAGEVERTYWDYALALNKITIYTDSLDLARRQQDATAERIKAGQLPEIELSAAQAEVALRQEDLINARSNAEVIRLRLLRLLNTGGAVDWSCDLQLRDRPATEDSDPASVEDHVALALRMRPDLNQARLRVRHGDLEIVRTRDGLLPRLDLFIRLGATGYADAFGPAVGDLDAGHYDAAVGLDFIWPAATGTSARHSQARLTQRAARAALDNMTDLAQLDVRTAYIEVTRTGEQVAATAATRRMQDETLRAELEKFNVGRSTTILVAQAQRDAVAGRIAEQEAVSNHLKALIALYRADGSLLERRGIEMAGRAGEE